MTSRKAVAKRASYFSIWTILLAGSAVAAPKKQQLAQTDAAPQINYYNAPAPSERRAAGASVSTQNNYGQSQQQVAHQSTYQGHNTHSAAQYNYYAPAATAQPQTSSRNTLKSLFKNAGTC